MTGGAGFIGSHLVDYLMESGNEVICLDNFFTGSKDNVSKWTGNQRFELVRHDIVEVWLSFIFYVYIFIELFRGS